MSGLVKRQRVGFALASELRFYWSHVLEITHVVTMQLQCHRYVDDCAFILRVRAAYGR